MPRANKRSGGKTDGSAVPQAEVPFVPPREEEYAALRAEDDEFSCAWDEKNLDPAPPGAPLAGWRNLIGEDQWNAAYSAMVLKGDQRPLAELFKRQLPVSHVICGHLGRMLDPNTDPEDADRLVFSRSRRLARKMKSHQDRTHIGLEYLIEVKARPNFPLSKSIRV